MPDEARWRWGGPLDRWRATTSRQRRTALLAAGSAAVGLAVATTSVLAAGPWDSGQRTAERQRAASGARSGTGHPGPPPAPAPSAAPVLAPLGAPPPSSPDADQQSAPLPTGPGLADALEPLLRDDDLGPLRAGAVVDVATGRQLYGAKADAGAIPASTIKLATGVAALSALGPGHRLTTRVTRAPGEGGRVVLVGGGDPTLTARAVRGPDGAHVASLRELADDTARALRARDQRTVRLDYDTSLYTGPATHPIGSNENLAPVTALMVDEGRRDDSDRGPADRVKDPAAEAARTFARLLRDRDITVTGTPRPTTAGNPKAGKGGKGENGGGGATLASVRSQPLSTLVERMLTNSDNDIAEALARHTARATDHPASFAGARQAVTAQLRKLGLPVAGARLADGSGLDRADRISAGLLARVLARAAGPGQPALRPVLTGLPVAGFTGTLRDRYAHEAVGRGVVRAKTGTLTGVNTLAGTVVDADGRLLAFAFLTNDSTDPAAAQRVLDRLASAVANCGCR
ncbi:D-alanyl-D-alanine carboxypeptidase/D-alanyl-D-alanine-endopeptidase [Streptomyces sp. NPDC057702]|uniref:D-alanyl-D-alanine carboxypeptidase/D-alanyl-D-alanine endopeptidase n=1 Tax=unclassified Streptomyces TaxID=2593676 RepID=UPI0036C8E82C